MTPAEASKLCIKLHGYGLGEKVVRAIQEDAQPKIEYCKECNTPLSNCGPQDSDGEPSLDCQVCILRSELNAARTNSVPTSG